MLSTPGAYMYDATPVMMFNSGVLPDHMVGLFPDGSVQEFSKAEESRWDASQDPWRKTPLTEVEFKDAQRLSYPGCDKIVIALASGHILDEMLNIFSTPDWLAQIKKNPVYVGSTNVDTLTIHFPS